MKIMITLLATLAALLILAVAGFVTYLWWNQEKFILPAQIVVYEKPDLTTFVNQPLTITVPDGTHLRGILFPATAPSATLILAFPGNMHDPVSFATYLKKNIFPEGTYAVAAVSYRGYPNSLGTRSEGKPSQATLYADALTIYDTLQTQLKPTKTLVAAYSVGTAIAVNLAVQRPIARMALFAPPASIRRIIQRKYPWLPIPLLLRNPFATEDIIANLKTPTTVFYAKEDEVVPVEDITGVLHAANPAIPLIPVPGKHDHMTILTGPEVQRLLTKALKPAQTSTTTR